MNAMNRSFSSFIIAASAVICGCSSGGGGAGGGCSDATACAGTDDACQRRTCTDGVCGVAFTAMDMAIPTQTSGDCKVTVCNGNGGTKVNNDDTDTASNATVCTADTCVNGLPTLTPVASGTMVGDPMAGDCKATVCDGNGGTMSVANDADTASDATVCTVDTCVNGLPTFTPVASGTMCSEGNGSVCNAAGACKLANGAVCAMGSECATNSCNGSICTGPSCIGLPSACGPVQSESCCVSSVVTGGTCNRSNDAAYPATVSDFRLDRFEITVGRFRKFVEAYPGNKPSSGAGAHPLIAGSGWDDAWNGSLPLDQAALIAAVKCNPPLQAWTDTAGANENLPMSCIDWYESFAFCAWDGGRMPTEAEWNYAAAGGDQQRQYPWGATAPDASYAVYDCLGDGSAAGDCVFADILTGGSKSPKGDGRWGQADLGGSMWEWTLDWDQSPYANPCINCANISQGTKRVIRGGGWNDGALYVLSSYRYSYGPSFHDLSVGVRCARTL